MINIFRVLQAMDTLSLAKKQINMAKYQFDQATKADDPLGNALIFEEQGWKYTSAERLDILMENIDLLVEEFGQIKCDNGSIWKTLIPAKVWKYVGPIAADMDYVNMCKYYLLSNTMISNATSHEQAYQFIIRLIGDGISVGKSAGVGVTLEDVIAKCDIEAYAEYSQSYVKLTEDKINNFATQLLCYFFVSVMAQDGNYLLPTYFPRVWDDELQYNMIFKPK